jgi:taurine dioxygenase
MTIIWEELNPFGVQVELDLSTDLSAEDVGQLQELFGRYGLIVAHDQSLTREQQNRVTGHFGPVISDGVEVVSNDPAIGVFGTHRLAFHSDLSFLPVPLLGAALYAVDVEPGASATKYLSGTLAYGRLGDELADKVANLSIQNIFPHDETRRNSLADQLDDDPRAIHPLVQTSKRSGATFLYLCEMQAAAVVGMEPDEGEALLQQLLAITTDPAYVYEHVWNPGDIVIWDNMCVQHGRESVADVGIRTFQRTSFGTLGFFDQVQQYRFGDKGVLTKVD